MLMVECRMGRSRNGRGWSRNGGWKVAEADLLAVFGKNGLQFGKKCDLESNFVDKVTGFAVAGGLFAVMMGSK